MNSLTNDAMRVGEDVERFSESRRFSVRSTRSSEDAVDHVVLRSSDGAEVARWVEKFTPICHAFMGFYCVGDTEWLIGGTDYMHKLFVNCTAGVLYDNVTNLTPESCSMAFIWVGVKVSCCGTMLLAEGCIWAFPYEQYLYDLTKLETTGLITGEWMGWEGEDLEDVDDDETRNTIVAARAKWDSKNTLVPGFANDRDDLLTA